MNPNDETIYQPIEEQDRNENNEVKEEKVTPKSEKKGGRWAKLTIGGVTGIFMGAGAMYAGKPYVDDLTGDWRGSLLAWAKENGWEDKLPEWLTGPKTDPQNSPESVSENPEGSKSDVDTLITAPETTPAEETAQESQSAQPNPHITQVPLVPDELHVATVDQNLSFGEAFAQARAEVGAGGVFHWHGGLFNTYTETEWNAMSALDRSDFAQQVAPEVHHRLDFFDDMAYQTTQDPDVVIVNDPEQTPEPDIQILGVQQYVDEDGSVMNAGFASVDGEPVVMIDVEGNGVFDGMWHDVNHNGQMEADEVIDISDSGATVDEFAEMASAQGGSTDDMFNSGDSVTPQDELAQDMPDYTNDVDTSDLYNA